MSALSLLRRLETSLCVAPKPSETMSEREEQKVKEIEKKRHRKHRGRKRHSCHHHHRSASEVHLTVMMFEHITMCVDGKEKFILLFLYNVSLIKTMHIRWFIYSEDQSNCETSLCVLLIKLTFKSTRDAIFTCCD